MTNTKVTPKFDVDVQLTGIDGNAFAIILAVQMSLRSAGATKEQLNEYQRESLSGDYDNVLQVAMKWVNVK